MSLDAPSAAFVQMIAKVRTRQVHEMSPAEVRERAAGLRQLFGEGPPMHRVAEVTVGDGPRAFTIRLLVPQPEPRALIVYLHGGGWVTGCIDDFDAFGRKLALASGCAVALVDYRLAPEHPFPAPVEDACRALAWSAREGNVQVMAGAAADDLPLIVAGDSAGANLATVAARRARDESGPRLAAQVLLYPVTDADFDRPSYRDPENQLLLSADAMRWYWGHYLPEVSLRSHPDASPLHAPHLNGLPRTLLITAECDPLRDEGEAYAARLAASGVPLQFERHAGQFHGFATFVNVLPGSERALAQIARFIDTALAG